MGSAQGIVIFCWGESQWSGKSDFTIIIVFSCLQVMRDVNSQPYRWLDRMQLLHKFTVAFVKLRNQLPTYLIFPSTTLHSAQINYWYTGFIFIILKSNGDRLWHLKAWVSGAKALEAFWKLIKHRTQEIH